MNAAIDQNNILQRRRLSWLPGKFILVRGRAVIILIIDLMLCALSWPAAIMLRVGHLDLSETEVYRDSVLIGTPLVVIVCGIVFCISGVYRTLWRYVSLQDIVVIARSVAIALAIFAALLFLSNQLRKFRGPSH